MKPVPKGWPRLSSALYYRDAASMIDWLCKAYGFEIRLKIVGDHGRIEHSELVYGESLIMVGSEHRGSTAKFGVELVSPLTAGCNTQCLMLFVDDVDDHCAHARKNSAKIVDEPAIHDYGEEYWADRSYGALDPEGHFWWFSQRLRNPPA